MRFLKVNLFRTYSLNEQVSQKISLALSRYKKHLSVYKDKIDKNLFNFYNETDRFHDYQIVELSYKFDPCNKKSKILLLKIRSYDNDKEFEIHFSEKFSSKIKYNSYFLDDFGDFSDIVLCEIGFRKKLQYFALYTANGLKLDVVCKNISIKKISLAI